MTDELGELSKAVTKAHTLLPGGYTIIISIDNQDVVVTLRGPGDLDGDATLSDGTVAGQVNELLSAAVQDDMERAGATNDGDGPSS